MPNNNEIQAPSQSLSDIGKKLSDEVNQKKYLVL